MKNLDLNNYGIQELNSVEMRGTDGGDFLSKPGIEIHLPGDRIIIVGGGTIHMPEFSLPL